jgi:hypothetical protein
MATMITKIETGVDPKALDPVNAKALIPLREQRQLAKVVVEYEGLKTRYETAKAEYENYKAKLLSVMSDNSIKSLRVDLPEFPVITITRVNPNQREKIDTAKLKLVYPEIAAELTSYTDVSPYVRMTISNKLGGDSGNVD